MSDPGELGDRGTPASPAAGRPSSASATRIAVSSLLREAFGNVNNQVSQLVRYDVGSGKYWLVHGSRAFIFGKHVPVTEARELLLGAYQNKTVRAFNALYSICYCVDLCILVQFAIVLMHFSKSGWVPPNLLMAFVICEGVVDAVLYANVFVKMAKLRPYIVLGFYVIYYAITSAMYELDGSLGDINRISEANFYRILCWLTIRLVFYGVELLALIIEDAIVALMVSGKLAQVPMRGDANGAPGFPASTAATPDPESGPPAPPRTARRYLVGSFLIFGLKGCALGSCCGCSSCYFASADDVGSSRLMHTAKWCFDTVHHYVEGGDSPTNRCLENWACLRCAVVCAKAILFIVLVVPGVIVWAVIKCAVCCCGPMCDNCMSNFKVVKNELYGTDENELYGTDGYGTLSSE